MKQDLTDWLNGTNALNNAASDEGAQEFLLAPPATGGGGEPSTVRPEPDLLERPADPTPQAEDAGVSSPEASSERQRAPLRWPTPPSRRPAAGAPDQEGSVPLAERSPLGTTPMELEPDAALNLNAVQAAEPLEPDEPSEGESLPAPQEVLASSEPEESTEPQDAPQEESTPALQEVPAFSEPEEETDPQDALQEESAPAPQASYEEETEVPAHAISRPADWDPDEEEPSDEELERDLLFSKRLHQVIQMRRDRAEELRGQESGRRRSTRRRAVFCTALLLVALIAYGAVRYVQSTSYDWLSDRAERLYREERYEAAIDAYEDAHLKFPDSPALLMGLARSAIGAGRFQTADLALERCLQVLSQDDAAGRARALYEKAAVRAALDDAEGAVAHLLQSTRYAPNDYDVYILLGQLLERQGKAQDALRAYRVALDLRPSSEEADTAMRRMLEAVKASTESKQDLRPAYEKRIEVGTVALNLKRYDEAVSYFSQALEIRSDDPRPWLGLADAWRNRGEPDKALKVLDDARKTCPGDPTIETLRGEVEEQLGPRRPGAGGRS